MLCEILTEDDFNIIAEGSIDRIFKNYGLIILDMLSTRVLSSVLNLDIPVIIYVPADFPVHTHYFKDLSSRVNIVRSESDLIKIMDLYNQSELQEPNIDFFTNKYLGTVNVTEALKIVKLEICG